MSAEFQPPPPQSAPTQSAESALTLGDVLYGADFQQRTPETDWIAMLRGIAGGDTGAFGNLYMLTHGIVFTLLVRISGARGVAEELTIEVFHDVWRKARDYDPAAGTVIAWIMNLARERALARQRPDGNQRWAVINDAVRQLTPEERQAVEATFHAGTTSGEVAARQGQPVAEVESRIRTALSKLAGVLSPEGEAR